ncbi:alkene reductase [Marinomonas epiphytica]
MNTLFDHLEIGDLLLANRFVMAPMTRARADDQGIPNPNAAQYYAQRASAGLIISEATYISEQAKGAIQTPGIFSLEQISAWRKVTDAVHEQGGKIFCQLWHVGRVGHENILPKGEQPLAPSAIHSQAFTFTHNGFERVSQPKALTKSQITQILDDYKTAALAAQKAGFDGVEIHAANGYLVDQFIRDGANQRQDEYGGSLANRARFLLDVIEAIGQVWPAGRIGVRLTPTSQFNDMSDSDPLKTFSYLYQQLDTLGLAYLHVGESMPGMSEEAEGDQQLLRKLRTFWHGVYIVNGGFDAQTSQQVVESGYAQGVSFGRLFIANPDLPERFAKQAELNPPDMDSFYGGDQKGYIDYPFLTE